MGTEKEGGFLVFLDTAHRAGTGFVLPEVSSSPAKKKNLAVTLSGDVTIMTNVACVHRSEWKKLQADTENSSRAHKKGLKRDLYQCLYYSTCSETSGVYW
jgi:hypothetical protein